jgi:hypothetical protein
MMKRILLLLIIIVTLTTCDNIAFLDYLEYEVDYYQTRKALDEAVQEADDLLASAVEGTYPGEYAPTSKYSLESTLLYVRPVQLDKNATLEQLHMALTEIENALRLFKSRRIKPLDILFVTDLSYSMYDEVNALKGCISNIINYIITMLADVRFGAGSFIDYPEDTYGNAGDWPFQCEQPLDSNSQLTADAITIYILGTGADIKTSLLEALFQSAMTMGWRDDADRIIIVFTQNEGHDSDSLLDQNYPGHGMSETIHALNQEDIKVVPIIFLDAMQQAIDQNAYIAEMTGGTMYSGVDADSGEIEASVIIELRAVLPYFF